MDIYKRLLGYIYPHRYRLAMAVVCMFFLSISQVFVSAVLYIVVNGFYNDGYVIIKNIPHAPDFIQGLQFPVSWIPLIVVGVFVFRGIFDYASNYQMAAVGIRAIRKVRDDLYEKLVHLSLDFYSKGRTGELMSRILNDVGFIQGGITDVLVDLVKQPFVILFNIPMIFIWGGPIAVIAIIVFPIVLIPIAKLGKQLRGLTRKMQERTADISSMLEETFTGIRIVKAFNMEQREIEKFKAVNRSVFDFFKKTIRVTVIQRPIIEIFAAIGASIAIWFGYQHLPPDRFVALVGSLFIFYEPFKKLSKVNSTIQQSIAAGNRIFEVMDQVPSVQSKPNATKLAPPIHTVSFHDVHLSYDTGGEILSGISIEVRADQVLAIVGPSGSGKTSLVNLIPRFYDPTKGGIKINGADIRDYDLKSLREQIGIVSQETVLFNTTVMENIAYGKPSATLEQVIEAAKAAFADEFIHALPNGYGTIVGEKGVKLSGGQRQRLSIARALLKNPPILILDEATSQLDTESERQVQVAIDRLMKGRTVFVIAHRLSTIQSADRIIVLERGKVAQAGTNDRLLQEDGPYKRLYNLQFNV